jgi:hypothetical protein
MPELAPTMTTALFASVFMKISWGRSSVRSRQRRRGRRANSSLHGRSRCAPSNIQYGLAGYAAFEQCICCFGNAFPLTSPTDLRVELLSPEQSQQLLDVRPTRLEARTS